MTRTHGMALSDQGVDDQFRSAGDMTPLLGLMARSNAVWEGGRLTRDSRTAAGRLPRTVSGRGSFARCQAAEVLAVIQSSSTGPDSKLVISA